MVEAFSKINDEYDDIYLILTGNINSNYKNILKRIDELGLAKKIRHLGCISYEELLYVYKMSIMLVMPTLLKVSVFQSMSHFF